MSRTVLAAGTIPWRRTGKGRIKVLLIERRKRQDRSFPKGKLDSGESMPVAAVRETEEEVGLRVALGPNLGTISYVLGNGDNKTVQYWAAEVSRKTWKAHVFEPNKEVASIEWVPLDEVRETLTYPADREIFDVFKRLVDDNAIKSYSITLLRHAKAMPRGHEFPEDRLRPLSDKGEDQAETIVPMLEAFGPARIETSTALRCTSTVAPLAARLGVPPRKYAGLSQDAWDEGETWELRRIVTNTVAEQTNAILCAHRPVLPDIAREIAAATRSRPGAYLQEASDLPTAGFSVFHIAKQPGIGILSVETYPIKH
ncbi:NUDIX hydrolase [Leucobacter sp. GX24907]